MAKAAKKSEVRSFVRKSRKKLGRHSKKNTPNKTFSSGVTKYPSEESKTWLFMLDQIKNPQFIAINIEALVNKNKDLRLRSIENKLLNRRYRPTNTTRVTKLQITR